MDPQWFVWEQQFLEKEKQLPDLKNRFNASNYSRARKVGPTGLLVTAISTFLIITAENKMGFVKMDISEWWTNLLIVLTATELLIVLFWSMFSLAPKNHDGLFSKKGIYAIIRHPIYTVVIFHLPIIVALFYKSFVLLFFLPAHYIFWSHLVEKEEEYLVGIFGEDYVDYMAKTPRFVPWR